MVLFLTMGLQGMPSKDTWFGQPGGNKPGRTVGARDKINERTLKIIAEVQAEGNMELATEALKQLRKDDPKVYWRLLSGLLPKQVQAEVDHTGAVTFVMKGPVEK